MDQQTARALNALNLAFYRERAGEFSRTRERAWPGWQRLLAWLPPGGPQRVLDVGCGNARFARFLASHHPGAVYVGVDASEPLLDRARARLPAVLDAQLRLADFVAEPPQAALPAGPFTLVALFGVLHGVPGAARRRALVEAAATRLASGGILALTAWRFAELPDLRRRIVPWSQAGAAGALPIDPAQLEPGDHLIRWGTDGALRYGHALDAAELARLCAGLELTPVASYLDDGRDRQRNRYALCRADRGHRSGVRDDARGAARRTPLG
jgi:SAM-dependent methyltransferase